jgi:hypothetical protein
VEPTPLEQQIGDLDVAIDRLRSLYDQYFMGIERIEPAVPRKDVERKIYALRKEQIRNTALRFRFQMILQRYSTFQSHWQRICREIENGTYKRQLRHSERRRAPEPEALQELAPAAPAPDAPATREALPEPGAPPPRAAFPEPGAPLPRDLAAELEELDRDFAPATPRGIGPPATRVVQAARPGPAPARTAVPPNVPAVAPARPPLPPLVAPARPPQHPGAHQSLAPTPAKPPPVPTIAKSQAPAAGKSTQVPPAPPSAPGKVAPAAAAAAPPPRRDGGLPEYRVRQLYVEYVDAKRRQKESTAAITYEALAESLRASSTKLREKHGKPIDFEVGLKDGKAVLRPKIK